MPLISTSDVGQVGIVIDRKPHELPPHVWSAGQNVRARNGFIEKFLGESTVFGTPGAAPYNLLPGTNGATYLWAIAGLTAVYAYNGTTHTDITRAVGGAYGATADQNWTMVNFQGIPILNNGIDVPQMWTPVAVAQKLQALSNWNAAWLATSVRAFRQFLVAVDVTKSGVRSPRMVKWSHPAAASAVPASWDETDATKDAGEFELSDTMGYCIDGATLRDLFVIYKEDSVWGMQFVGGPKVMRFFKMFDGVGILSKRCVVEFTTGKHALFAVNDIIVHDGQNKVSIVEGKLRRWWFGQISSTYYRRCFVVHNREFGEVWFCAPTGAATFPNLALVWNYVTNTVTVRELSNVAGGEEGVNNTGTADVWDVDAQAWDSDPAVWDAQLYNPAQRRLFFARPSASNVLLVDDTNLFGSTAMTAYVERTGLGVPFKANRPPDTSSMKFLSGVWPRIEGTVGGVVRVYVGASDVPGATPTYQSAVDFTIGTTKFVPVRLSGRLLALKFESVTDIDWRLHGYDLDVKQVGGF